MSNKLRTIVCALLCVILFAAIALPAQADGFVWRTEAPYENDEDYQAGLKLFKEGKYFSAYESFMMSDADDASERADACIQKWPKNGEVWRSKDAKSRSVTLVFNVNQSSDTAYFVRLYLKGKPVSYVFIGGKAKVTVKIPSGKYKIKDGTGTKWFGVKEAFGRYGSYETMSFDDNGTTEVNLKSGGSYEITVNVQEPNPDADPIYSEYEDFEGFAED